MSPFEISLAFADDVQPHFVRRIAVGQRAALDGLGLASVWSECSCTGLQPGPIGLPDVPPLAEQIDPDCLACIEQSY